MEERFTDLAWTSGDFNKATTSPSQTSLTNWMWFNKYHLIPYLKFKEEKPSSSFKAGTFAHDQFQNILIGQSKIEDVESNFFNHFTKFIFDEKHSLKVKFIERHIKGYVERHLEAIKEISGGFEGWEKELSFSDWYNDKYMGQTLNLANEGHIDCVNHDKKIFTEHKNNFGSVSLKPLKIKKVDTNTNRIGDYVFTKATKVKKPMFTHCIQTSIYSKHFNNEYKPYLIYVNDTDYIIFSPDNCWELSPEGLKYFFKKFIQINIQRQEMLRFADGNIKKLAMIIGVDWSEIRNYKSNFLLENYHEEDMQRLEKFYEEL